MIDNPKHCEDCIYLVDHPPAKYVYVCICRKSPRRGEPIFVDTPGCSQGRKKRDPKK